MIRANDRLVGRSCKWRERRGWSAALSVWREETGYAEGDLCPGREAVGVRLGLAGVFVKRRSEQKGSEKVSRASAGIIMRFVKCRQQGRRGCPTANILGPIEREWAS